MNQGNATNDGNTHQRDDKLDPQDPQRHDMQPPIPTHPPDPAAAGDADTIARPAKAADNTSLTCIILISPWLVIWTHRRAHRFRILHRTDGLLAPGQARRLDLPRCAQICQ